MNVLEHLREWSASQDEWDEICRMQYAGDLPAGPERDAAFGRMADLLDSYADRMERSGLVRAFTTFNPEGLRAEAAVWRSGRDPHEGCRDG